MAELWEGHQRFTFQASLFPEYNGATDPCQGEVLHQWPWRFYHHGEFLSWLGDNYQAPSHSHLECQVADRLVRAADHYSRFWENCKIYIINLFLNYGNGCRSISGRRFSPLSSYREATTGNTPEFLGYIYWYMWPLKSSVQQNPIHIHNEDLRVIWTIVTIYL